MGISTKILRAIIRRCILSRTYSTIENKMTGAHQEKLTENIGCEHFYQNSRAQECAFFVTLTLQPI